MMKNCTHFAVVPQMNEGFFLKNGSYQFLNNKMIDDYVKTHNNNLMEVDYCGMGFYVSQAGILEKFEYPWFQPETSEFTLGNITIKDYNSEDVSFVKNAKN